MYIYLLHHKHPILVKYQRDGKLFDFLIGWVAGGWTAWMIGY